MKKSLFFAFFSLALPFISLAHEGHGVTQGFTITHYFVEPEHAVFTWSFLLLAIVVIVNNIRTRKNLSK